MWAAALPHASPPSLSAPVHDGCLYTPASFVCAESKLKPYAPVLKNKALSARDAKRVKRRVVRERFTQAHALAEVTSLPPSHGHRRTRGSWLTPTLLLPTAETGGNV